MSYPTSGTLISTSPEKHHSYAPSGISTRDSIELESVGANPGSSGSRGAVVVGHDENDPISGLVTRPTTSSTKYDVYSQLAHGGFPLGSFLSKIQGNTQASSHTLSQKFNKLIRLEKKVMKQQEELIRDVNSWCNVLPNDDCKKLMYHLIKIMEAEASVGELSIKKQNQIIGQLASINKREKRSNELKFKRNKVLAKLRENENKMGDTPVTVLTKENLEELECSVEVVEDQFIRSVNSGLKNAFVDYVSTLRNSGRSLREAGGYFLDSYGFNTKPDGSGSNLQRLIFQNRYQSTSSAPPPGSSVPPSMGKAESRDLATSLSYQKNYIALSPNHVGKYLDNVYDVDNRRERHRHALRSGPPPTPELDRHPTLTPSTAAIGALDQTDNMINPYHMPGGLNGVLRPSTASQHNREWTT